MSNHDGSYLLNEVIWLLEILEDHADFFRLCQYCLKPMDEIKDGGCLSCREKLGFEA